MGETSLSWASRGLWTTLFVERFVVSNKQRITLEALDQAIEAAEKGFYLTCGVPKLRLHLPASCGTACCVAGFARLISGMELINKGLHNDDVVDHPRAQTICRLMKCCDPIILKVMKSVNDDGIIRMPNASLKGADINYLNLAGSDFTGSNFSGSDLSGSRCWKASFRFANLQGADLSNADFYRADLSYAKLKGANLSGINLHGANLCGTEF